MEPIPSRCLSPETSEDNPETINHPADIVLVIDDSGSMDDRVSQKCAAESYSSHEEWYPIVGTVTFLYM